MNTSTVRIWIVVALFSASFALAAFALSVTQLYDKAMCDAAYHDCGVKCEDLRGIKALFHACNANCDAKQARCYEAHGIPVVPDLPKQAATPTPRPGPSATAPPNKSHPTPTPRKGPGNISGLPESNPTPTPRKGPGKTGTTGIGHSSPTPSPKGPVLLEKSGKPSPTPRPTPKKRDRH